MGMEIISRLSQIHDGSIFRWCLRVFVIRAWLVNIFAVNNDQKIHMILIDEEGVRIDSYIENEDVKKYRYLLSMEGAWFTLSRPVVEKRGIRRLFTPHSYLLRFNSQTKFEMHIESIPRIPFKEFHSFQEIYEGSIDNLYPIDVIGAVTWVGELEFVWNGPRVQFTLRNTEHMGLECLAFGNIAKRVVRNFWDNDGMHLFVILRSFFVLTHAGHSWLRSEVGPSDIQSEKVTNPNFYRMIQSYPNPPGEGYSDDHRPHGFSIF